MDAQSINFQRTTCSRVYPERRRNYSTPPEKKYIAIFNHPIALFNHGGIDTGNAHSRARERERERGKTASRQPPPPLPVLIPISTHLRSLCVYFNRIAVLPSYSPSDAFPVPDDRFIVPSVRSAPMPLLVRLARFYGEMLPCIVGFWSCEG